MCSSLVAVRGLSVDGVPVRDALLLEKTRDASNLELLLRVQT